MKLLIFLTILAAVVFTVCGHVALDVANSTETLEGVNGNVGVDADKNAEELKRPSRSFCCGGRGRRRPYRGGYGRGGYGRPIYGGGGGGSFSSSYSQSSSGSFSGSFGK